MGEPIHPTYSSALAQSTTKIIINRSDDLVGAHHIAEHEKRQDGKGKTASSKL